MPLFFSQVLSIVENTENFKYLTLRRRLQLGYNVCMEKRIYMYRWKAYNYRDIKAAFMAKGYEVDEVWQHLDSYDVAPDFAEKVSDALRAQKYDFVFTVNYFPVIAGVCHDLSVPYVSWSCDNPLIAMHHESVFYDTNIIFTFDQTNYREFKEMGVKNIHYLPLCVDTKRIDALLSARDATPYKNVASFVGSLYERNSYDRIEHRLSDHLRGYFEAVMEIQSDLYGSSVVEEALTADILAELSEYFTLEKSPGSFSDLGLIFSTTTLGYKIAQIERMRGLNMLSKKMPVTIYTGSDTSELFNVTYRGSVDYWEEMPLVFCGSDINLNFTIPNIKSGLPLRIWDVLGCGGFLLTNFQAETPMYFSEGEDLVSFYSREDMVEKALYYASHDEKRRRIAASGRKKVEKHHTYEARINEMLDVLKGYGIHIF